MARAKIEDRASIHNTTLTLKVSPAFRAQLGRLVAAREAEARQALGQRVPLSAGATIRWLIERECEARGLGPSEPAAPGEDSPVKAKLAPPPLAPAAPELAPEPAKPAPMPAPAAAPTPPAPVSAEPEPPNGKAEPAPEPATPAPVPAAEPAPVAEPERAKPAPPPRPPKRRAPTATEVQAALRKALAYKGAQSKIAAEAGIDAGQLSYFKKTGKGLSTDALGRLAKVVIKKR